jgi:hypothetical protein
VLALPGRLPVSGKRWYVIKLSGDIFRDKFMGYLKAFIAYKYVFFMGGGTGSCQGFGSNSILLCVFNFQVVSFKVNRYS